MSTENPVPPACVAFSLRAESRRRSRSPAPLPREQAEARWLAFKSTAARVMFGDAVAIQHIKLENEGIERDYAVGEPTEPSFTEPAA